jgi:GTP 3',8-cyclase
MNDRMKYLRVSLLKACNFNCFYCRPPSIESYGPADFTDPEQFKQSIKLMRHLGINRVRFTGGEPTLYPQVEQLIAYTKSLDPAMPVAITTNGRLLKRKAQALADAGLDSVNISIDTADSDKFRAITTVDCFDKVVDGIREAVRVIPTVKLNCVVVKGVNDNESRAMVDFANDLGVDMRFIEFMPTRHSASANRGFVSGADTMGHIGYAFAPAPTEKASPARYYSSPELRIQVGFINSVSEPFCVNCNRIRLTSDGMLYSCLFSGHRMDLFEMLEDGYEVAEEKIDCFMAQKLYVGCHTEPVKGQFLPSLSEIGG